MTDPTRNMTDSQLRNWVRGERSTPPDREKVAEWLVALDELRAREQAARPVLDAACAYADSTAEPTDAPHEDALLDAVAAYRGAMHTIDCPARRNANEGCYCGQPYTEGGGSVSAAAALGGSVSAAARVRDGWADLPLPEDVAAEMSRQMAGSDTSARRESLMDAACRALDAVGTLREKGVTRAALGSATPQEGDNRG